MARTHVGVALAPRLALLSEATAGGASRRHPTSPALARCACPFGGNRARAVVGIGNLGSSGIMDVCPPRAAPVQLPVGLGHVNGMQLAARSAR